MVGMDKSTRLYLRSAFKGLKLMLLELIFFNFWLSAHNCVAPSIPPGAGGPSPLSGTGNRSCHKAEGAGSRGGAGLLQQIRATSLLCLHPRDGSELLPYPWK